MANIGVKTQAIIDNLQRALQILSTAMEAALKRIAQLSANDESDAQALAAAKTEIEGYQVQLADVDATVSEAFAGVFDQATKLLEYADQETPKENPPVVEPNPEVSPTEEPPTPSPEIPVETAPIEPGEPPLPDESTSPDSPTEPFPPVIIPVEPPAPPLTEPDDPASPPSIR